MHYRLLPGAVHDLREAADFYRARSPALAESFLDDVEGAAERACVFPTAAPLWMGVTRRIVLTRFPFSVIYLTETDEIIVVAVAHDRRKPGYWHG